MKNGDLSLGVFELKLLIFLAFGIFLAGVTPDVWAQATPTTPGSFQLACTNVQIFFSNFEKMLKIVSVVIVTIAIVFAGYQIAFAHKRLSDVAPILVGGLLIGGASAIAGWFTASWVGATALTC